MWLDSVIAGRGLLSDAESECAGGLCTKPELPSLSSSDGFTLPPVTDPSQYEAIYGNLLEVGSPVAITDHSSRTLAPSISTALAEERAFAAAEAAALAATAPIVARVTVAPAAASLPGVRSVASFTSPSGPDWNTLVDKLASTGLEIFRQQTNADTRRYEAKQQTAADVAAIRGGGSPSRGFAIGGVLGSLVPIAVLGVGVIVLLKVLSAVGKRR